MTRRAPIGFGPEQCPPPVRPVSCVLLAAVLMLGAVPSVAQDGWTWVERSERATRRVAHEGTLISWLQESSGRTPTSIRVWYDGKGRWRREHLGGPTRGLVVFCDGRGVYRREPQQVAWQRLSLEEETPAEGEQRWQLLRHNYRAQLQGQATIAGRTAARLDLQPVHPGNPSRRLWIDRETFLILRQEQFNSDGLLYSWYQYQTLRPGPVDAGLFQLPAGSRVMPPTPLPLRPYSSRQALERALGLSLLLPTYLPPGYQISGYFSRACREGGSLPVIHFQDGLNTLSLFEVRGLHVRRRGWGGPRGRRGGPPQACRIEARPAQKVASFSIHGRHYLLIGDIAQAEMEKMVQTCQ